MHTHEGISYIPFGKFDLQTKLEKYKDALTYTYEERRSLVTEKLYRVANGNIKFPSGLAQFFPFQFEEVIPKLANVPFRFLGKLLPYQEEAVNSIGSLGLIVLPTGTGKTVTVMGIIDKFKFKTLIVCERRNTVSQFLREFKAKTECDVSSYTGESKEISDVTITTYKSMQSIDLSQFGMVIVDEVHHAGAENFFWKLAFAGVHYRVGLTATAFREDWHSKRINALFGKISYENKVSEHFGGMLVKADVQFYKVECKGYNFKDFQSEYRINITKNLKRNLTIFDLSKTMSQRGLCLILVKYIEHGEVLAEMTGYPFINGKTKSNDEILGKFRNGEIKSLIASTILDEAVDIPNLFCLINSGSMENELRSVQRIGRLLRKGEKENPLLIDFMDVFHPRFYKYSLMRKSLFEKHGYSVELK